jgi:predicted RNA binding protein YcfA (HicA-like mRNA interferase family)
MPDGSPKFANIKPRDAVRALQGDGWFVHESTGSHVQLEHPHKPGRITVPYHAGFDIPKPIVKSIIRQAGLTNKGFFDLLRK